MTDPQDDVETAELMKSRLGKIKDNPELALFSEFKGSSRSGAVTASVDLLGRLKRIHIAPGTLHEGAEQWLTDEISSACKAAQQAANFLDFDVAEFAAELENTPALKRKVDQNIAERAPAGERERRRRQPPDDDEWFESGPLGNRR
ncbi:YbaB/EbfC family nucleoid-associated protein [Amycolatopsis anabasis]|uniref:YbaB/EbfC family nucleoid-associated protein n=1 Tax=Amycolatopsis anabasis TaxID=1840409 RepID=UPI00131A7305|nr:YbaB/EbfC family nucleoid-associated protein [Amycolatopsis anabasis]